MKKTLLVGLDAACWSYLEPLLQDQRLPTLQSLISSGVSGTLQSTLPALTPVAWTSIITGKNPGKHGIFDMVACRPGTYDFSPVNAQMRIGAPFWQHLNNWGIRVGLVNIPFTYPPTALDGFWVAGFGTPNSVQDIVHPSHWQQWLKEEFGSYLPSVEPQILKAGSPAEVFEAERQHQALQVSIATELTSHNPVDILAINLMLPDHANHLMPEMELVQQALCESDRDLGRLIQAFQPDNVMLISDHGSRRVKGDFLLHTWLRDQGYAVQVKRSPKEQARALNWILMQWLQMHKGWSGLSKKMVRQIGCWLIPRLPEPLSLSFWKAIGEKVPFAHEHMLLSEEVDFTRTSVFLGGSYSGILYLNIVGHEPSGVVSPQERAALTAEIVEKLSQITDPESGQPLFSGIYTPADIYSGPAAEYGPDIILDGYNAPWNILGTYRRGATAVKVQHRYFADNQRDFGHHSREGIFVFSGQDFKIEPTPKNGHVMDIPATLLHLYDVPIPDDYDGHVLVELLTSEFVKQHSVSYQSGDSETAMTPDQIYSAEETEQLVEHLKALGYVD